MDYEKNRGYGNEHSTSPDMDQIPGCSGEEDHRIGCPLSTGDKQEIDPIILSLLGYCLV